MNNKNETVFSILGVLGMIAGILFCITIVGAIIGIPIIIGANRYSKWAKQSDEQVFEERSDVSLWGVVYAIFIFPIGLIALIPVFNLKGQITNAIEGTKPEKDEMDEKIEKIKKLHEMKEKGIIDEEDFKTAKQKLLEK